MARGLEEYRDAFIERVRLYLPHEAEHERFVAVLDYFTAWSERRPALRHHDGDYDQDVVSFARRTDGIVFWSAYPRQGDGAKFEMLPGVNQNLTEEQRSRVIDTIRSMSREPVSGTSTLKVNFAALKSPFARERMATLLDGLLAALPPHGPNRSGG